MQDRRIVLVDRRRFAERLRSPNARRSVHLATAEMLGDQPERVTDVTRDTRVRDTARALGYQVE